MPAAISHNPRKRGRPKTTGKGHLLGVRMPPEELAALDAWIAAQPAPIPTRPEAIRGMVRAILSNVPEE